MSNIEPENDRLLDRKALATRWSVSIETIKRREKAGSLQPVYLAGKRTVRYRLSDILKLETPSCNIMRTSQKASRSKASPFSESS